MAKSEKAEKNEDNSKNPEGRRYPSEFGYGPAGEGTEGDAALKSGEKNRHGSPPHG